MTDVDRFVDPATGLSSERHFQAILDFVFPIAHRGIALTLVVFRIDDETWNRGESDPEEVVAELGSTLRRFLRNTDLIARVESDMFVCLLPLCNLQGGLVFADRMRDHLEEFTKRTQTTVSAGVASHKGDAEGTSEDMLVALKRALAAAQSKGGDRVEIPEEFWNV